MGAVATDQSVVEDRAVLKPENSIDALLACQRHFAFLQQLSACENIKVKGKRMSLRRALSEEADAGVQYVNMAIEALTP